MTKIILKKTSTLFLAIVFIAGTISLLPSPDIMRDVQAAYGYEKDENKYMSTYFSYQSYNAKFKDNLVKKINCNNINLNVNYASVNVGKPQTGDFTSLEIFSHVGDEGVTLNSFENVERFNGFKKFDKDFAFICINNNNNECVSDTGNLCSEGFTFVNGRCQMVEIAQATCPDGTPATSDTCTVSETTTFPAQCPVGYSSLDATTGECQRTITEPLN